MASTRGGYTWGSDTDISMPEPLPSTHTMYVDMGGFCFTQFGIAHNITEAEREIFQTPTFAPTGMGMEGTLAP
jgi:hypothetical protein